MIALETFEKYVVRRVSSDMKDRDKNLESYVELVKNMANGDIDNLSWALVKTLKQLKETEASLRLTRKAAMKSIMEVVEENRRILDELKEGDRGSNRIERTERRVKDIKRKWEVREHAANG